MKKITVLLKAYYMFTRILYFQKKVKVDDGQQKKVCPKGQTF